jgi:hypothetical protein
MGDWHYFLFQKMVPVPQMKMGTGTFLEQEIASPHFLLWRRHPDNTTSR